MKTMNTTRICKHLRVTLKHSALAVAVAAGLGSAQAVTPRSFTGTAITENFDGLTSTGTDVTVLTGWDAGHFSTNPQQGTTGGNGLTTVTDPLVVDDGNFGTGGAPILGNFGTISAPDRALGSFARTTPAGDQFLQVAIKNDSGSPITTFELTYTGEEWRSSNAAVQQLTVWYSATDASSGFVSMGSGFTFNSPNNSGSNIAIDGNATGNRTVITGMFTPATPIADGSTVYIRWYDINDNGIADDYLAIDDLSFGLPVPAANILTFGPGATIGALSGNAAAITWYVQGTSAAALSPTFTLSDGATCTVAGIPAVSGETRDFTSPVIYRVEASDYSTSGTFSEYTVTVVLIPVETTVLWDLNGGGTWDVGSPNWKGQASNLTTVYTQGNSVIFDKTTGGTITITPGMEPLTTTVSATSGTYTFSGGPLAGTGSLTKSGGGTLTLFADNTYSGGTIIDAGQLTMDQAHAALGTGPVTLNGGTFFLSHITAANALIVNGGTLHADGGWGGYWDGPVTLNADLNIEVPGYDSFAISGSISGAGGIILNDGDHGPVRLQVANSYTGPTSVTACTLECNNIHALGSGPLSISSTINSKVTLNYTGEHDVASLTLGGMPQASGTYGSTASGADHQNDTYFGGTGKVRVPASSFCDMLTFSFGALGAATIGNTTITLEVPFGTNRTNLAPTYTVSPGATCSPDSGTPLNFTGTQSYTVTAEDGIATKTYYVTVTEAVLADVFTWATAVTGGWSDSSKWTNELATGSAPLAGGTGELHAQFHHGRHLYGHQQHERWL